MGQPVRLDDQWRPCVPFRVVEPCKRAIPRRQRQKIALAGPANAQRIGLRSIAMPDDAAQQCEIVIGQPVQQVGPFRIRRRARCQRRRIGRDCSAHRLPVGHRSAHIAKRGEQVCLQLAPQPRIGAFGFQIDYGFAGGPAGVHRFNRDQRAIACALNRHDRMDHPFDDQPTRGHGSRDGIDKERHVVVDDRHAQESLAGPPANAFHQQSRFPRLPHRCRCEDEACRVGYPLSAKGGAVPRKDRRLQPAGKCFGQQNGRTRGVGGHMRCSCI